MAVKQVGIRMSVVGGREVEATLTQIGTSGARAMKQVGDASTVNSFAIQNASYQVQDFFVQVSSGTDISRALGQQLPQLLGPLGLVGVLAGTAAAALIPLASYMFSTGEAAVDLDDRLKGLEAALADVKAATDVYSMDGVQGLIDKYGELDAKVLLLIERQRAFAESQAMTAAQDFKKDFGAEFDGLLAYLDEYESRRQQIMQNTGATAAEAEGFAAMTEVVFYLNEEFGVTIEQAQGIQSALEDIQAADSLEEMADATSRLAGFLEGSSLAGSDMEGSLLDAESALRQLNAAGDGIGGWLGAAIDGAVGLAGQLWDAADAAFSVAQGQNAIAAAARSAGENYAIDNDVYSGRGQDPREFMGGGRQDGENNTFDVALPRPRRGGGGGRRRGGGGGRSDVDRQQQEDLREAARLFDATRTEAEQYASALADIDRLLAEGDITADVHARSMANLAEEYKAAAEEGLTFKDAVQDISDSLIGAARNGENLADALGNAFADIAASLAATQLENLLLAALGPVLGAFDLKLDSPILSLGKPNAGLGGVQAVQKAQAAASKAGASVGGAVTVNLIGGGFSKEDTEVRQSAGPNGERQIDIMFKKAMKVAIAGGSLDRELGAAFGLRRVPG